MLRLPFCQRLMPLLVVLQGIMGELEQEIEEAEARIRRLQGDITASVVRGAPLPPAAFHLRGPPA